MLCSAETSEEIYGEIFVSSFDNKNWNSSRAYLRNQTCKKVFRSVERQFQMMKIIAFI